VNPRPSIDIIERGYQLPDSKNRLEHDTPFNLSKAYQKYYTHGHEQDIHQIQDTLTHLVQIAKRSAEHCRLLDFGCGDGIFLEGALGLGIDAYGCDLGDWNTKFIEKKTLRSRVFIGRLVRAPYPDESFDIIHANAVLGHLYEPRNVIEQLRQKLKSGGIMALMSTPNIDSLFIRLGVDSFDGNVPLTHLNFFSKKTLSAFLQRQGFQIMHTRTWGVPLKLRPPSFLVTLQQKLGLKGHQETQGYYQSQGELSIEDWQDDIIHSRLARMLKKYHCYGIIRTVCNRLLNLIDGGQVVDIIVMKH
jgi:2-polyprenyl-3-methyl-5-hydroxy-6-metoxy-1,4-benzoquinol methylase